MTPAGGASGGRASGSVVETAGLPVGADDNRPVHEVAREALVRFALGAGLPMRATEYREEGRSLVPAARSDSMHGGSGKVVMPISAATVMIRRNALRIMRPAGMADMTAKVCLSRSLWPCSRGVYFRNLLRSIRASRFTAGLDVPVSVPVPVRHHAGGMWLIEPLLQGRFMEAERLDLFLPALSGFHRATRRLRPLDRAGDARQMLADLLAMFPHADPGGELLPVAFIHDDISGPNLLQSADGRFSLLDWDMCGVKPVAYDLAAVCAWNRDAIPECVAILDDAGTTRTVSPRIQLALGLLHRTTVLRASDTRWNKAIAIEYGVTPEATFEKKRESIEAVREFIADLLRAPAPRPRRRRRIRRR